MKNNNVIITLIGIIMVTLFGCGEKKITVKGADGTEYESYQEACRAGDFEAAHKFLDVLHDNYVDGYGNAYDYNSYSVCDVREKYHAALNAIFKQEMMFFLKSATNSHAD